MLLKVRRGRGRKLAPWNQFLQEELCREFERLSAMGMNFSSRLIAIVAKDLTRTLQLEEKLPMTTENGKVILDVIHAGWVQRFMERYNIVSRRQFGKLMMSPAKQIIIEKQVAFHLGTICRDFECNNQTKDP